MAANENTKFQINYKLSDGTLINLYATDVKDLETGLTDLSMVSALIKSTSAELAGGNTIETALSNIQAQFNTTQVAAPAPVVTEGQTPTCKHGNMTYRNGTSAKGPWRAWMCSAPRGAADKCDPIFLR